jgi:uncharacterized membrane protein
MKQNTFYVLTGVVATALVGIFWLSMDWNNPLPIQIAFIAGIIVIYLERRMITGVIEDERSVAISQKAAFKTLEIFWVVFFTFSLSLIVWTSNRFFGLEQMPSIQAFREHAPPGGGPEHFWFNPGFIQLGLLCLMIFLYAGFKFYYERKYGGEDADEE